MQEAIKNKLNKNGLIPVVAFESIDSISCVINALVNGGIGCIEVTYRTDLATEAIKMITNGFPDVIVGAGTVLSVAQAKDAINAGAEFVVSPGFDPDVVDYCISKDVLVVPGCVTPTEIISALKKGINIVKFFPSKQLGGVSTINALAAPFRQVKFIPSGGVNEETLSEYMNNQHVFACSGSWMLNRQLIWQKDYEMITKLTQKAVDIIKQIRQ